MRMIVLSVVSAIMLTGCAPKIDDAAWRKCVERTAVGFGLGWDKRVTDLDAYAAAVEKCGEIADRDVSAFNQNWR